MEIRAKICFLDLKIIVVNDKLETTTYSKHSDLHIFACFSSHKSSTIIGIQKGVQIKSTVIQMVPSINGKVIQKLLITLLQRSLK